MFWKEPPAIEAIDVEDLKFTDPAVPSSSCCCLARPVVRVTMPPTATRPHPVDLWLCGHHYRASVAALLAAGASVEHIAMSVDSPRAEPVAASAA